MFGNLNTPHFLMVVFSIQIYCQQRTVICSSSFGVHLKGLRANPSLWPLPASVKRDLGAKMDPLLVVTIFLRFKETVSLKQDGGICQLLASSPGEYKSLV